MSKFTNTDQLYRIITVYQSVLDDNHDGGLKMGAVFTTEDVAKKHSLTARLMPAPVVRHAVVLSPSNIWLFEDNPSKLHATIADCKREAILSKLTPEEREYLGLK